MSSLRAILNRTHPNMFTLTSHELITHGKRNRNTRPRRRRWARPGVNSPEAEEGSRMLARHRQSLILEDIRRAGSVRVSDLTQRLGVSDMTIRRDLEVL